MDTPKRTRSRHLPALAPARAPGSMSPEPADPPIDVHPDDHDDLDLDATPYAHRPARPWAQLATRAGVWGAIGIGCVGAIVGLVRPAQSTETPDDATPDDVVPATVANYAELAVETWLTATEDDEAQVDLLFAEPLDLHGLGDERRVVERVASIGGTLLEDGYWKVTVAADVVEPPPEPAEGEPPADEGEEPEPVRARWFVEIGVVGDANGGLVAVDAPALMTGRTFDTSGLRLVGPELEPVLADDPVAGTLRGFFDAYLTGRGDLSRYLAEGVEGSPITPAPFAAAAVDRMSVETTSDDRLLIRAEVRVTTRSGIQQLLGYELQAQLSSSGRWEISHAAGAPTLVRDADATPDTTAATSPPSSSAPPTDPPTDPTPTTTTAPTPGVTTTVPPAPGM